jgi:DNA/RNA non-specific endonuclease
MQGVVIMGWDVVGGLRDAAGWASDKIDGAVDGAGHAIDGAVHGAEHAVDDARHAIVDFGEHHAGVVGKVVAHQVSDTIGEVEGVALGAYDAGAGLTKLAVGAGRLLSPLEWAGHPQQNLQRLSATGNTLTAMAKLGSPVEWALHTQDNLRASKALWNGATAGYQDAAKSGDAAKFAGRAMFDVGSLFIGVGEANAAVKGAEGANALAHAAQATNALVHGGEAASALSRGAEVSTGLTRAAEGAGALSREAEAAKALSTVSATAGRNTVTWTVDAQGRTVQAEATLNEVFSGAARTAAEQKAQGDVAALGRTDDVGGHIFGHRFVKDQGTKNLFPQNVQFNNSAYRTMENEWAGWISQGKEVKVEVGLSGGTATRPDRVNVRYEVIDPATGDVVYARAKPFTNEAGQTFDRVPSSNMK